MKEEAKTSRAWLLDLGSGLQAAVGNHEMWQIILSPTLFDVPVTQAYCNDVLIFQGHILPVINIPNLLGQEITPMVNKNVAGIAVYQDNPANPIHYGCLLLASMPQNIYVNDDSACELPHDKQYWQSLAISSFSYDNEAIPIINLASLFSKKITQINHP